MSRDEIQWTAKIGHPWTEVAPIDIGNIPSGLRTPDQFILFRRDGLPHLRVHAYAGSEETYTFRDALVWQNFLVIGWGHGAYLVHLESQSVIKHRLASYFGHLYSNDDTLLIATAEGLMRVGSNGLVMWQSEGLGIDGVIVHNFDDGTIRGSGEWDPPGGWKEFQIRMDTGERTDKSLASDP